MSTSSIIGSADAVLGDIVLGQSEPSIPGTVSFVAYPLDSTHIFVRFSNAVTDTALDPEKYNLWIISPWSSSVPEINEVLFTGSSRKTVILSLSHGLTSGSTYTLQASSGIESEDGGIVTTAGYNFTATVPSIPRPVGAYISENGCVDVVFNKDVGPHSTSATATITPMGGSPQPMILHPWDVSIDAKSVRFLIDSSTGSGESFTINYSDVCDASLNKFSGETDLYIPWSGTKTYDDLVDPRVIAARIDRVTKTPKKTRFLIYFSTPITTSSAEDLNNISVTYPGTHLNADISNVITSPTATDASTLQTLANEFKTDFNQHLVQDNVHIIPSARELLSLKFVELVNHLVDKFNSHIMDTGVHAFESPELAVVLPIATNVEDALARMSQLYTSYNQHLTYQVSSVQAHVVDDTDFQYSDPVPTTSAILTLCQFVDIFYTKFWMHLSATYHGSLDTNSIPTSSYTLSKVVYPAATDYLSSAALVAECVRKACTHFENSNIHTYSYDHSISYSTFDHSSLSGVLAIANSLATNYNAHSSVEYNVPITSAFSRADTSSFSNDGRSYFAQYEATISSLPPTFNISINVISEYRSTPTSSTFTGEGYRSSLNIRNAHSSPGTTNLFFDSSIELPDMNRVTIKTSDMNPIQTLSMSLSASPSLLVSYIRDIIDAYNVHTFTGSSPPFGISDGAGHRPEHYWDLFSGSYPASTLDDAILSLNSLKDVYNTHVQNDSFHYQSSIGQMVTAPNATDVHSAVTLAADLGYAIRRHNSDTAAHSYAGPDFLVTKLHDVISISHGEIPDGKTTTVSIRAISARGDQNKPDSSIEFQLSREFIGQSDPPYTASAEILTGNYDNISLGSDRIIIRFSKDMMQNDISIFNFPITGGSVITKSVRWTSPREVTLNMIGTSSGVQYTVSPSGLFDTVGNLISP